MGERIFDREFLSKNRGTDWYGNNAALPCPVCGKLLIVSGFVNKEPRPCPHCGESKAQIIGEQVRVEWPDAVNQVKVLTRAELERLRKLEDFIRLVAEGGAITRKSIADTLRRAEKVAFIERADRMVAVAALKRASRGHAAKITEKSEYELSDKMRELGYVAVSCEWRGLHLSSRVVDGILSGIGDESLYATTSDPKMKSVLGSRGFRWVGKEFHSEERPAELLSLWIRVKSE